jgi:DNA-binding NtrC family response regulator
MQSEHAAGILVVEDGQSEREALARVLRLEGYRVFAAPLPEKAMELINEPIDLIVSDLRLGKQNALDLLKLWRDAHPNTPFILMTAYGDVDSAVRAMKLGAEDFLSKPVDPRQLLSLIDTTLKKHHESAQAVTRGAASEFPTPIEIELPEAGPTIDSLKRAAMLRALEHFHGNRTRAAEYLGISVRTLQRKLKEWNLAVGSEHEPHDEPPQPSDD